MNENLNLVEILKDCPKGTNLYSTVFGDVEFMKVFQEKVFYPIEIKLNNNLIENLTKDGRMFTEYSGECTLFPSREQRDWSKFKLEKPKFDPKTLQAFDKVLVRDTNESLWRCAFYSHKKETEDNPYKYVATSSFGSVFCIPYNEDTKHLVGTDDEAPEFNRYWED